MIPTPSIGSSPGSRPGIPGSPGAPGIGTPGSPAIPGSSPSGKPKKTKSVIGDEIEPPKCFGTDYFGKWNPIGMTFEAMRIDRPEQQTQCANCSLFEKCYQLNHIRLLRIKG